MTSIDSVRSEVSKTVRFIFLASKLTILGFSLFTFLFSVYCHSSSKSDVCLTSLLSNAGRFIPEKKLGYNSVLFWHKVDSIISLSRVEHANFFFCQHTSRVTKFEAGLNFSIENHRQQNQPKFKIPSSKASSENPNASRPTPGKN